MATRTPTRSRFTSTWIDVRAAGAAGAFAAVLLVGATSAWLRAQDGSPDAVVAASQKLARVQDGVLAESVEPITFSEKEVNAWIAAQLAGHPAAGVDSVVAGLLDGRVVGTAQLDFDALRRAARRPLPPLSEYILTGTHEVRAEGRLDGRAGEGRFTLERVSVDGLPMPPFLLELLLNVFLRGRYPGLDLDAPFDLPYSIHTLRVKPGAITVAGARAAAP